MHKQRFFDFTIKENEYFKVILRFYPKRSHVHGFNDTDCPDTWDAVYKVYYSWNILGIDKGTQNVEVLFSMSWDECSCLVNMANCLAYVLEKKPKEPEYLNSTGQPGSEWKVCYHEAYNIDEIRIADKDHVKFYVWNNFTNCGYRFALSIPEVEDFITYLRTVNAYMLAHSEPI